MLVLWTVTEGHKFHLSSSVNKVVIIIIVIIIIIIIIVLYIDSCRCWRG